MPTGQIPRGANMLIYGKKQSAFKTAATGNFAPNPVYSYSGGEVAPFVDDDLLGTTQNNSRDATTPGPGLSDAKITAVVPLDFMLMGFWLEMMFGAPVVTGTNPNFIHTFNSGSVALPFRTIERQWSKASGSMILQDVGVMADKMSLQVNRAAGYARASFECVAYGTNKLASTGAGTPVAALARDPIATALGVYKMDAVVAQILDLNVSFANNLSPNSELGDARMGGYEVGKSEFSGTIRMRIRDTTMLDAAIANTSHAGEILFSKNTNRSLSLQMPVVRLERPTIDQDGPEGIDATFNIRGEQTSGVSMVTCVYKTGAAAADLV
jgi:hypothetical protein